MSTTYAGNRLNYPTSLTLPSGGDARNVSSVNAPLEGLADRTAWLAARAIRNVQRTAYETVDGTWNRFTSGTYTSFAGSAVTLTNVAEGDILLLDFHATVRANNDADGYLALGVVDDYGGDDDDVLTTGAVARVKGADSGLYQHVHLSGVHTATLAGTCRVTVRGKVTGTEAWLDLVEAGVLRVVHLGTL